MDSVRTMSNVSSNTTVCRFRFNKNLYIAVSFRILKQQTAYLSQETGILKFRTRAYSICETKCDFNTMQWKYLCAKYIFVCYVINMSDANVRSARYKKQYDDTRVSGALSASYDVSTAVECSLRCLKMTNCNQYNLGPVDAMTQRSTCELMAGNSATISTATTGWSSYISSAGA